jgi:hypothetical protein
MFRSFYELYYNTVILYNYISVNNYWASKKTTLSIEKLKIKSILVIISIRRV